MTIHLDGGVLYGNRGSDQQHLSLIEWGISGEERAVFRPSRKAWFIPAKAFFAQSTI